MILIARTENEKIIYQGNIIKILLIALKKKLVGRATPVIINDELPEEVEFQMMTQQEYERMEKEEMFRRFDKMFFEN